MYAHPIPAVSISSTTTQENKTGSWKTIRPLYQDRVAPCNQGCPVGIDIEAYMNLLRQGRIDDAIDLLLRENPMPATTGRVCHHPCENSCNRRSLDSAVSIRAVEKMLGDLALERSVPEPAQRGERRPVAVVGSGPAGLGCAYHLARLGYDVTVFEAGGRAGGVLRTGIPEYRLPARVVDREIDRIRSLGVKIRCRTRIGLDVPWQALDGFDAVFLATGAPKSRKLGLAGEEHDRIRPGLDFLHEVKSGVRSSVGHRVVVIGGGNTAMDCARTALRLGAAALVLYRRDRPEMPAFSEEVSGAEREGVVFQFLAAPVGVRAQNGTLQGLDCVRMRLGDADASGRRRPHPIEGSRLFVPCDMVLTAVGEDSDPKDLPPWLEQDGRLTSVDDLNGYRRRGVFAGGDIVDQPRTVADALGSGKRAAIGIDRHLRSASGEEVDAGVSALRFGSSGNVSITRWRHDDPVSRNTPLNEVVPFEDLNADYFLPVPRNPDRHLPVRESRSTFAEVNRGLDRDASLEEARRCFNCGVCNQCELCLIFCPDIAISRGANGAGFSIAYDFCKGCGVCSHECPRGAMSMTREGL
jgi:NADPH-dependent glutamate synthase beta subunit-like oxidoreductase